MFEGNCTIVIVLGFNFACHIIDNDDVKQLSKRISFNSTVFILFAEQIMVVSQKLLLISISRESIFASIVFLR